MSTPRKKSIYSVHPGVFMTQKWIAELKQKTGRSLEEWVAHINKSGPKGEKERRAWLKEKHGLGTNVAMGLAERAEGKGKEIGDPDLYLAKAEVDVEKMFSGGKAQLRPLYDALLKLGLKTGKEAKACPCSTIVRLVGCVVRIRRYPLREAAGDTYRAAASDRRGRSRRGYCRRRLAGMR